MKKQKNTSSRPQPARSNIVVFGQLLKLIPRGIVNTLAATHGIDLQARTFSPLSHLASMLFLQFCQALSLNDICDWMGLKALALAVLGVTPPARNTLSHANKTRDGAFAKDLFWQTLGYLRHAVPGFEQSGPGGRRRKRLPRFKVKVHAVDSSVLELVANCMSWAKHRRRKAAAKLHLRLGVQSFLPNFAVIDIAKEHDNMRAREVCADLAEGEIVLFDKAYVDFDHLWDLDQRGVRWVTRAKANMQYKVVRRTKVPKGGKILKDEIVRLTGPKFKGWNWTFRRVEALVVVDEKERIMVFITNGTEWSPRSVCDLYKARWEIEVFFKQMKQTLQLASFVGHSANALQWQVWTALLAYVLLRFQAYMSGWRSSFSRLFTVVRACMWERLDLLPYLKSYGTEGTPFRILSSPPHLPSTPYLNGWESFMRTGRVEKPAPAANGA